MYYCILKLTAFHAARVRCTARVCFLNFLKRLCVDKLYYDYSRAYVEDKSIRDDPIVA